MTPQAPSSLAAFGREVLPMLHGQADGRRTLRLVKDVVATDQWVSFDRFRETADTLAQAYVEAGAGAERVAIPTGGRLGSGRWVVPEASDVHGATMDLVGPVRRRVLDYRRNPFHVTMLSAATPPGGVDTELVVIDSLAELAALPPGALRGKTLLTRLAPRGMLGELSDACVDVVVSDTPIPGCPDGVGWQKLGFGGIVLEHHARRPVCLSTSERQGAELRRLQRKHGIVRLHTVVDTRQYQGSHDVVCGLVRGSDLAEEEVLASAHTMEPGAVDNASGVAASVEIARLLESLIAAGQLPRPRRTIRLLSGYECFGIFDYFERAMDSRRTLAGVAIDSLGTEPEVCDGRLGWIASVPGAAGFADRVGATLIRAALRVDNPGYRFAPQPFMPTSENFVGDPQYGFPCPWITTSLRPNGVFYDAYHSSADTVRLLNPRGLAVCASAMAGYLYYLANAGDRSVADMVARETRHGLRQLGRRGLTADQADGIREEHARSLRALRGFADHDMQAAEGEVSEAHAQVVKRAGPRRRIGGKAAGRIPRRIAPLTPLPDNLPENLANELRSSPFPAWTLFWADGERALRDIARRLGAESGQSVSLAALERFFELHVSCGYVEWR